RDYFRDFAFYCDPENIDEIKSQVIKALSADFDDRFIDLIKEEYSWEKTAEQTLEAYKRVLNEKN
ncbi:glycosyltransferase family 1 protein, partial [bacterium]|nr:glycosyltransferase family 1 protein [bacterium]